MESSQGVDDRVLAIEDVLAIAPRTIVGVGYNPARIAAGNEILRRHGFTVVTATSIPAALAACAALHVDAVVVGRSVPQNSAQALSDQLRHNGGPPVLYLANNDDNCECVGTVPNQKQVFNQHFFRMLRTILLRNRLDQNPRASVVGSTEFRNLRTWWLASLFVVAILTVMFVDDTNPDYFDAITFFSGLMVCILCEVGCLHSQLQVIDDVRKYRISADLWYPRIALGMVFLLPGVLVEVGWFLLSIRRQLRRHAVVP